MQPAVVHLATCKNLFTAKELINSVENILWQVVYCVVNDTQSYDGITASNRCHVTILFFARY